MNEIDSMDFIGYLKIRAYSAKHKKEKEKEKAKPKATTIDKVWPGLAP